MTPTVSGLRGGQRRMPRSSTYRIHREPVVKNPQANLAAYVGKEIEIMKCPQTLNWLTRSIREIMMSLGVSKRTDPSVAYAKAISDLNWSPLVRPVGRLLANGVRKVEWFLKKVMGEVRLGVEIFISETQSFSLVGQTISFLTGKSFLATPELAATAAV